jgi:hypothetical protein
VDHRPSDLPRQGEAGRRARRDGHHVLRDDYIPAAELLARGFGPADLETLTELTGLDGSICYNRDDVSDRLGGKGVTL